jgi:hypothetical protein
MSSIQVKAYFLKQKKISKEAITSATEIRRFNIEIEQNDSYNSLLHQIRTFFQNVLSTNNSIKTFYLDEENEFIGFSSDSELKYALNLSSQNSLFKIYITLDKDSKDNLTSSSSDENENLKCKFKEHHWRKWKNMMDSSNQLKNSNDKRDKIHERKREQRQFFWRMWKNMMMEKQSEADSLKDEKLEGEQSNDESKKHHYHGHHCKQWKILKQQIKNGDQLKPLNDEKDHQIDQSCNESKKSERRNQWRMWKNMMENREQSNESTHEKSERDQSCEKRKEQRRLFWRMWKNMMMEKQNEASSLKDEKLEGEQSCDESKKHHHHGHHCKQWKILKHQIKNCDQSKNPNMNGDQSSDDIKRHPHHHHPHKKCLMRKNMMENSSELKDDVCEDELKEIQFKKLNNLVEFEEIEKQTKPKNELEQDIIINLPAISTEPTKKEENNLRVHNPLNLHETKSATSSSSHLFPKLSVEPNLLNKNEKIDDVSKTVQCLKEMGFDDNCNWLTALVQSKKGNINEVLDALSPISSK